MRSIELRLNDMKLQNIDYEMVVGHLVGGPYTEHHNRRLNYIRLQYDSKFQFQIYIELYSSPK